MGGACSRFGGEHESGPDLGSPGTGRAHRRKRSARGDPARGHQRHAHGGADEVQKWKQPVHGHVRSVDERTAVPPGLRALNDQRVGARLLGLTRLVGTRDREPHLRAS